jgi:hypothetical protein
MRRIDHVALALSRLPQRLQKPRWQELTAALARSRQKAEDTLHEMLAQRAINLAVGVKLDELGSLVAQPRDTSDDVVYRRRIFAKIAVNRSIGLPDDLLRIARLVISDRAARLDVTGSGATAVIQQDGAAISDGLAGDLAAYAQRAASAGVRVLLQSNPTDDEDMFVCGWIPEEADGAASAGDAAISLIGDGLPTWPQTGRVTLVGNTYAYNRISGGIAIAPALVASLGGGESVEVVVIGKGLGDSTEAGQPCLVPYTSPGTTGGQLADVR